MTKSILAALTIALGLSAAAGGAAAGSYDTGIYANLPDWKLKVFTSSDED